MQKNKLNLALSLILITPIILSSCNNTASQTQTEESKTDITPKNIEVSSIIVEKGTFNRELICNGTLKPVKSAKIEFRLNENITNVFVKNGQAVTKGDTIAKLDNQQLLLDQQKAKFRFEKAKVELQDILLAYNHKTNDSSSVADKILHFAKIRSGYYDAEIYTKEVNLNLSKTTITAPFNGVISQLKAKENNSSNSYDYCCYVIDNSKMEVEFNVIENELEYIMNCKNISITSPVVNGEFFGNITSINPWVDQNGMIKITALINNKNNTLLEGMNVDIKIMQMFTNKIIVPKEAVVKRQNRDVIFTLKDDSITKWNYVKTDMENSNSYVITEGITESDTIIIQNNQNLGHNIVVTNKLIKPKQNC